MRAVGKAVHLTRTGFVSTPEASELVGVQLRTLRRWIAAGLIAPYQVGEDRGATYGWSRVELAAVLAAQSFSHRAYVEDVTALLELVKRLRAAEASSEPLDELVIVQKPNETTFGIRSLKDGAVLASTGERVYPLALALGRLAMHFPAPPARLVARAKNTDGHGPREGAVAVAHPKELSFPFATAA